MKKDISRRGFLGAGAAAAGALLLPRSAGALARKVSANDRIVVANIGVGGMGRSHFDRLIENPEVHLIAACDPDRHRQADAKEYAKQHGQDIVTYTDYHEMLDQHPELDAVFVATPDHWHALATIDCIKAGKDVYCEKPLALTIREGQAMVAAARRYGRVVQMGTMQRSDQAQFRHACELVVNKRIGDLQKVVCFFGKNPQTPYIPDEDAPEFLDWNFYLGPAPYRRFNKMIHPYNFRYFRDYSGGLLTDWGVHLFDIAQWGAGKDATSPKRVEAETKMYAENMYEFPEFARIQYHYGDCVLEWQQGVDEIPEKGEGYGTKFYGTDGEVFVNRGGYAARDKKGNPINEIMGPNDTRLYESTSHHKDFFHCMRTRGKPICDVAIGHRATLISHLGNIATRLNRPVEFDPEKQDFGNDASANQMIEKPMRAPWQLS